MHDTTHFYLTNNHLRQLNRLMLDAEAQHWRSYAAFTAYLDWGERARALMRGLWGILGSARHHRFPCLDWSDVSPMFSALGAEERLAWCTFDARKVNDASLAVSQVRSALRQFERHALRYAIYLNAPGTHDWSIDSTRAVLDEISRYVTDQTITAHTLIHERDTMGKPLTERSCDGDTSAAGILLRW